MLNKSLTLVLVIFSSADGVCQIKNKPISVHGVGFRFDIYTLTCILFLLDSLFLKFPIYFTKSAAFIPLSKQINLGKI